MNRRSLLKSISQGVAETGRATRKTIDIPPYLGFIDLECDVPWMSLAMPVESVDSVGLKRAHAALELLRSEFSRFSRELRFELFDRHLAGYASVLETAGFCFDGSDPLLAMAESDAVGRSSASLLNKDATIETLPAETTPCCEYVVAARRAFGTGAGGVSIESEAAALRRDLKKGRIRCAFVRCRGEVVTTATLVGIGHSVELAGVGTIPSARGQGYASCVSDALIRSHFERGNLVWLSAGSDRAEEIYRRLGFKRIGSNQLNYHV